MNVLHMQPGVDDSFGVQGPEVIRATRIAERLPDHQVLKYVLNQQ